MMKRLLVMLVVLLAVGVNHEAVAQRSKKSVSKLSKQYVKYVKDKAQGKEKQAQKSASDPATVTRERADTLMQEAQDPMRAAFEQFRRQARADYESFRDKANAEYAEFMKQAWEEFHAQPAVPKPKEEDVPPVILIEEEQRHQQIEDKPLPIEEEVVELPAPQPQPVPVSPIPEQPVEREQSVSFSVYGTPMKVRFGDEQRFSLADCSEQALSDVWKQMSGEAYNNTIRDCLELRITRQLSDWAYLRMLDRFSKACFGDSNEATVLTAYLYCQSGYRMRIGQSNGKLRLLYATEHVVFDHCYFTVGSERYYVLNGDEQQMKICDIAFPKEQSMSLCVYGQQLFDYVPSAQRRLKADRYQGMDIVSAVNKNVIDFCNDYPSSALWDNFMTRWAMLANTPMEQEVQKSLYPQLQEKLKGLGEKEKMERLLNWVQTALVYEYDDKVWGDDRAFFAEETLFYPYADCEDRAILLSRLVRDLLGLKAVLVYYPGHLAMAVGFTEDVKGDYILLDGMRYVVCDPTYINAGVGMTMPNMDNATARVILLE